MGGNRRWLWWGAFVVAVVAVVAQTPGLGWRWRTVDTGVTVAEGLAYYQSSADASAAGAEALGSDWPGSPSEVFDAISDAEEDGWHYVGEAGEPAFESSWANNGGANLLAFRIREAGVVDVQGIITGGTRGSTIFTLPAGYRPTNSATRIICIGRNHSGAWVYEPAFLGINTSGAVQANWSETGSGIQDLLITGQMFINPAD